MQSNTYGPKYFRPNELAPNSRAVVTQELQRHQKMFRSGNPTLNLQPATSLSKPKPDARFYPPSAPKQITLNPYNTEALYQLKQQQDETEEIAPALASGMTQPQWKNINNFQIVGQSQRKKQNYHVAINHYFNLRAMYRRINEIKYKRQPGSEISTSLSLHRKSDELAVKPRKQTRKQISKPLHNYHLNKDIYYQEPKQRAELFEPKQRAELFEPKSAEKAKKVKSAQNQRIQSAIINPHNQAGMQTAKVAEEPAKKKKAKKKIKPESKSYEVNNNLAYYNPKEIKPKPKHFEVDDFKNTNEKELIAENLGLGRKGKREVDFDNFVVEQKLSNANREVNAVKEQAKPVKHEGVVQDYGDFLHKPKNKEAFREQPQLQKELNSNSNKHNFGSQEKGKAAQKGDALVQEFNERKPAYDEKPAPASLRMPPKESLNPKGRPIKEEIEAEERDQEGARSHDSENFELTNFQEKIKKSEISQSAEEKVSVPDDDDIMAKIPYLEDQTEEGLQGFKQQLIQMIFDYEIYNEEEFNNFYAAVCMKNEELGQEVMEEVFNEIKEFLYEQFQELAAEEGQAGDEDGERGEPSSHELNEEEEDEQ